MVYPGGIHYVCIVCSDVYQWEWYLNWNRLPLLPTQLLLCYIGRIDDWLFLVVHKTCRIGSHPISFSPCYLSRDNIILKFPGEYLSFERNFGFPYVLEVDAAVIFC
jgi:hypothetical protein